MVKGITILFFPLALRPNAGHGLLILEVSRSRTTTHHSQQDSSGRVISASQRPLPDKTQHSQQTYIHARGRIRTHNLSRREALDLRLRPRGPWDWQGNCKYSIQLRAISTIVTSYLGTQWHHHRIQDTQGPADSFKLTGFLSFPLLSHIQSKS